MIRPDLPSLLVNPGAAEGGADHAEITFVTSGEFCRTDVTSLAIADAAALCTPSAADIATSNCRSL